MELQPVSQRTNPPVRRACQLSRFQRGYSALPEATPWENTSLSLTQGGELTMRIAYVLVKEIR